MRACTKAWGRLRCPIAVRTATRCRRAVRRLRRVRRQRATRTHAERVARTPLDGPLSTSDPRSPQAHSCGTGRGGNDRGLAGADRGDPAVVGQGASGRDHRAGVGSVDDATGQRDTTIWPREQDGSLTQQPGAQDAHDPQRRSRLATASRGGGIAGPRKQRRAEQAPLDAEHAQRDAGSNHLRRTFTAAAHAIPAPASTASKPWWCDAHSCGSWLWDWSSNSP